MGHEGGGMLHVLGCLHRTRALFLIAQAPEIQGAIKFRIVLNMSRKLV